MRKELQELNLSIRKISQAAEKKEDCIRLDIGEPSFDTPKKVKEAAGRRLEEKQSYTSVKGMEKLRELVAREESMKEGHSFSAEDVMITTGGMEAIYSVLAAHLEPGSSMVVNDPFWGPYMLQGKVAGADVEHLEYFDGGETTRELREAAESAEIVVINTPKNPTGEVLSEERCRALGDLADDKDCFLLSDEVYWRLSYGCDHVSPAAFAEHSAVIGSMSKNHAMTGWRIGWVAESSENMEAYSKASRAFTGSSSRIGQLASIEALEKDDHVQEMRREYAERLELVEERVAELGWEMPEPRGAFYAFPEVGRDSWSFCMEMIENGVAMIPGEPFGSRERSVRIAYGAAEKPELERAFDRLQRAAANSI